MKPRHGKVKCLAQGRIGNSRERETCKNSAFTVQWSLRPRWLTWPQDNVWQLLPQITEATTLALAKKSDPVFYSTNNEAPPVTQHHPAEGSARHSLPSSFSLSNNQDWCPPPWKGSFTLLISFCLNHTLEMIISAFPEQFSGEKSPVLLIAPGIQTWKAIN